MGDSTKRVHVLLSCLSLSSSAPAMAPEGDDAYPHLVGDKRYALHGEILMLVLVLGFSLFLAFLVALPCLRRSRRRNNESQRRWCFLRNTNPRRVDEDEEDDDDGSGGGGGGGGGGDGASGGVGNVERNIDSEISRKFPL